MAQSVVSATDLDASPFIPYDSTATPAPRGMVWIIAAVCIAAWSVDAVLAWTASDVLTPLQVTAGGDTFSKAFNLSRWRNVAVQAWGEPGAQVTGAIVRVDGLQEVPFAVRVQRNGRATHILPAPKVGGSCMLRVQGDGATQVGVRQGEPHAHTAWWFYGFNAVAVLIFVAWRGYARWHAA